MAAIPRPAYAGLQCPRCRKALPEDQLYDGANVCPQCLGDFEARVFRPPQRSARVLQLAHTGPEGAVSCANHARNAAVAACDRCGLLICSLCQLEVGDAKLCPSCFERLSQDVESDATRTRFRDYGSLAGVWAFVGLVPVFGLPFALVSLFYCFKAFRHRESRSSLAFVIFALILALGDLLLSISVMATWFTK